MIDNAESCGSAVPQSKVVVAHLVEFAPGSKLARKKERQKCLVSNDNRTTHSCKNPCDSGQTIQKFYNMGCKMERPEWTNEIMTDCTALAILFLPCRYDAGRKCYKG